MAEEEQREATNPLPIQDVEIEDMETKDIETDEDSNTDTSEEDASPIDPLRAQIDAINAEYEAKKVHKRIIDTIHDFCMFMADLYIPDDAVLTPPEGGWPQITKESFAPFGKSGHVIEVLRHLTYLQVPETGFKYEFLEGTSLCNYLEPFVLDQITKGDADMIKLGTEFDEDETSTDVVGLTIGGRTTHVIMVNCSDATIEEGDHEGGTGDGGSVEEYFEGIKEKFLSMEQLPKNDFEIEATHKDNDGKMAQLREIYKRHGWYDDFDKEGCAAAVKAYDEHEVG